MFLSLRYFVEREKERETSILLATVGIKDGLTEGVIKLVTSESPSNVQTAKTRLNASCTNVTFKVYANPELVNTTEVFVTLESSIKSLSDPRAKVVKVSVKSCPTGFPLVMTHVFVDLN